MKAKLTFVSFFAVVTLLAIPAHSQDFLKRIKPWLCPDDSLDALGAKRMQPPALAFGDKNFRDKRASLPANFFSQLTETQSFSDSVQALWVSHYASGLIPGSDAGTAVAVDGSGNIYVTGYSRSSGTLDDYVTIKYNAFGAEQWTARYNGPGNSYDQASALAVDTAGNVYVTGYSEGLGTSEDYATVKYNASGVEQWVTRYNGPENSRDVATALAVDASGNVHVTGFSQGAGTIADYITVKYNAFGIAQWVARYNGPGNSFDWATALAVDATENVYVTGYSEGSGTSYDYSTIKYDASGTQQWVARYNGSGNVFETDQATALTVDATGNVYVTGFSEGPGTSYDYATIKYNASGVEQWVARYTVGISDDRATALALDAAGNVYVTGASRGSNTFDYHDYTTIKYNASGVEQWVARYNGPGNFFDQARALAVDAAGNVYVTGSSYESSNDYATIKYNASGVQVWVMRYNGPINAVDQAIALAVDATGNVYVTGSSLSDYATVKYNASGVEQWVARYNGPGNSYDDATALAVDAAGNVHVTGYSRGSDISDDYDYATIKYNTSGVQQWIARYNASENFLYNDDRATALAVDAAGNVYVTGYSLDSGTAYDYATVKYNASGVEQWVARYNGPESSSYDRATALIVDAAANVYVTGSSGTVKYNFAGIQQWVAKEPGNALAVDNAGNIYVTGNSATVKYNATGIEQWLARFSGVALAVDTAGNIYVTGNSATAKYNASGIEQWVVQYTEMETAMAVDAAGNVYVTGYSEGSGTSYDYATAKYNASGIEQWVVRYNGSGNDDDRATALAVDAAGNVYVTGYSNVLVLGATAYTTAFTTVKYNAVGVEQWLAHYNWPGNFNDRATAIAVDAAKNVYVTGSSGLLSNFPTQDWSFYTTIKYLQARTVTTNSATNVDATFATLNATVNPNDLSTTVKFQYGTTANYESEVVASPSPVIGTTPISVSAKVISLLPGTTYHFRIVATNNEETLFGDDQTFRTLPCGQLSILHPPVSFHDAGSSITATAQISGACGVDSVVLKYRRGGDKNFSTAIVSEDSLYSWTIPDSAVTSRGVEYFIAATDAFNATTTKEPRDGFFSIQVHDSAGVRKEGEQSFGSEQNAYRLISMPLDLDDESAKAVLEDNLGQYNNKKWRLFALRLVRPDSQAYFEYSDTLKMDPGQAFMLIVKDPGKFIDTGAGKSNRTDKPFSIVLHPRWNFVGNPFDFPIPLKNLSVKSGNVVPMRYHEGTWRDPLLNEVSEIKPFEGYAIFNTLKVADTLLINPNQSPSAGPLAKKFASTTKGKIEWSIRILAQCQDAFDEDNRAAIVSGASSNWDEFDQPEPPVIGEYVSAYFSHAEWDKLAKSYCIDARSITSDDGLRASDVEIWPFEVKTNIRDKVHLTFAGIESVPPEFEVWLTDEALRITQNLRETNSYTVAGSENPKSLKLVVGKQDFIKEKLALAQLIPTHYELSQNFPNPFNPVTTIRYGLPQAGRVSLKIYNLLGEEVAVLVDDEQKAPGYHVAIWDGRDRNGVYVASGIYVYRIHAGSFAMVRKMAIVK